MGSNRAIEEARRAAYALPPSPALREPVLTRPSRRWFGLTLSRREAILGVCLMLPALGVFSLVIAYPFLEGIRLSFYEVGLISGEERFVGLEQFRSALGTEFLHSLRITLIWAVGGVGAQVVLGIGAALLINYGIRGQALASAIIISPYLAPAVAMILVWRWMFNDVFGVANQTVQAIGLTEGAMGWLSTPDRALISLIAVGTWRVFPFVFIAVLGRLHSIPPELHEAARIDGGSAWSRFWTVTFPQLRGVLVITVFLRFIWDFNDFDTVALLTAGGPARGTLTLPLLVYGHLFERQDPGLAAATATIVLIGLTILLYFYFSRLRQDRMG